MKEDLTGKIRYRADRKGRLILQVERKYKVTTNIGGTVDIDQYMGWRDARIEDLNVEIRKGL